MEWFYLYELAPLTQFCYLLNVAPYNKYGIVLSTEDIAIH